MLFGFVCECRGNPNNPKLFCAIGAVSAEGVKVGKRDFIFIKTASNAPNESILTTLSSFGMHPLFMEKGSPKILSLQSCPRRERQAFFKHIKLNRQLYNRGLDTSYWYWLKPPLDSLGHPLPPPAAAYEIDCTPASRWTEYWDKCPGGEHCTLAILD
jgi:hypothetical protein